MGNMGIYGYLWVFMGTMGMMGMMGREFNEIK